METPLNNMASHQIVGDDVTLDKEEDVVVEEIPVYLSKNIQETLYLFQYPTKTPRKQLDNSNVVNCSVKPINKEVKIAFELDTESELYDRSKASRFAIAADGKQPNKGERVSYKRGIMDKCTFNSSKSMMNVGKYVVGIYAEKEFHISPLTSILQMRPSFSYFDKDDKRLKDELKSLNDEDEDEELQHVKVKFARTTGAGGIAKKIRDNKHGGGGNFLKRGTVDEPWCETYWHHSATSVAELERQKMFATTLQPNHSLMMPSKKYIEKILPSDMPEAYDTKGMLPSHLVTKARVRLMPSLQEQIKYLLRDSKMLSFTDILEILRRDIDSSATSESVIKVLPQVGTLLHGNWVLKSELLYPNESFSEVNGVCGEQMQRSRDYLLLRFSRHTSLYRRQVIKATHLPLEEVNDILGSLARLNAEKKWELRVAPNRKFEQQHPELVQRQEMFWRATEQQYNESIQDNDKSKRVRNRSLRDSKTQILQQQQQQPVVAPTTASVAQTT